MLLVLVLSIMTTGLTIGVIVSKQEQRTQTQAAQISQTAHDFSLASVAMPTDARKEQFSETHGVWKTSASLYSVAAFLNTSLKESGWQIIQGHEGTHNATRQVIIAASPSQDRLLISLERKKLTGPETTISAWLISEQTPLEIPGLVAAEDDRVAADTQLQTEKSPEQETDETPTPEFKVAFLANTGNWSGFSAVLELISNEEADSVIHIGGFDHQKSPDTFAQAITDTLGPDYPYLYIPGSHDLEDGDTWRTDCLNTAGCYSEQLLKQIKKQQLETEFLDETLLTEDGFGAYALKMRGIHLVALGLGDFDPGPNSIAATEYVPFIEEQFSNSTSPWKICSWQDSIPVSDSESGLGHSLDWRVYDACRRHGAIIFAGDDLQYSRSHLVSDFSTLSLVTPEDLTISPGQSLVLESGLGGLGTTPTSCQTIDTEADTSTKRSCDFWEKVYGAEHYAEYGAVFITFNYHSDPTAAYAEFKTVSGAVIDAFELSFADNPNAQHVLGVTSETTAQQQMTPLIDLGFLPVSSSHSSTSAGCRFDFNGDGQVNLLDFSLLRQNTSDTTEEAVDTLLYQEFLKSYHSICR